MEDVLAQLNEFIRAENGSRVTTSSLWSDTNMDSFGTTVIFFDMDEKYGCFNVEWLMANITKDTPIKTIIERVLNESKII